MGIKITTDDKPVNVWRNDRNGFPQYAITISKKGDDGKYIREYQQIVFRKGVELQNNDPEAKPNERVIQKTEKKSMADAMDIATIWLERSEEE